MHVTFYGAAREVTGSMHMLATETDRVLFDCGMFQGRRKQSEEKNRILPFDPALVTNVILSHAHIDHSGRIPLLTKNHFPGRILATRATVDACNFLLMDSAHIQESDAQYLNYKTVRNLLMEMKSGASHPRVSKAESKRIKDLLKKDHNELNAEVINELIAKYRLDSIDPLYTAIEAEHALSFFDGYPYRTPVTVGGKMTCTFYEAGHILGSAFSIVKAQENGSSYTIGYTGDIGRFDKPILKNPTLNFEEADRDLDLLIMESTYGNRLHEPTVELKPQLKKVLLDTYDRGGTVLIPSFAFGRTQELLYVLHELYDSGEVPKIPVYVDSPLAVNLTKVFGEHPELYDRETHKIFLEQGENPFSFRQIRFISTIEESMTLMREETPHIVISASGMCEAGRILHHLRYKIHNPRNTILIVGYMAENTLGRRILEQGEVYEQAGRNGAAPQLKFLNKVYPLKAHVVKIGGFSAHADHDELLHFLSGANLRVKKIAVVHGEEEQSLSFAETLKQKGYIAFVPKAGETVQIR